MIPSAPLGTDTAADRPGLGAATEAAPDGAAAGRRFRFELAAHPGSVAQARRLAHARLAGWSVCADTCESAVLVMSELVTNAIVHTASSRVVCELHDQDDTVRIAVRDEGCAPGEPHPSPQRADEEHGWGVLLVGALCRAWGVQEHGSGLLVWAELARRTEAAADTTAPRGDLGWGARPKPDRPDDSGEDETPEGRQRATGHPHLPHPSHPPEHQPRHEGPDPHQHRHEGPDPHQHRHTAPDPHRHRTLDRPPHQPAHRTPEQRRAGERP